MSKNEKREVIDLKFLKWDCAIELGKYRDNGRLYMGLVDRETGESITDATVNMPEVSLARDEVLIKDYSENEGLLDALQQARVLRMTGECVQSGFVTIPKCKLLIEIPERIEPGMLATRAPIKSREKTRERDRGDEL